MGRHLFRFRQSMMISRRCFLLVGFALVACTRLSTEGYTASTRGPLQRLIHSRSFPPSLDEEAGFLRKFDKVQKSSLRARNSSPTQVMEGLRTKDIETLSTLLLAIVKNQLYPCVLGIVWDSSFEGSTIVDQLSQLPTAKQVILLKCPVYSHVVSGSLAYMREQQRFVFEMNQH